MALTLPSTVESATPPAPHSWVNEASGTLMSVQVVLVAKV
jgi:hypothetical protein